MRTSVILSILLVVIIVESTALSLPYISTLNPFKTASLKSNAQPVSFPFTDFNRPISNNTDHDLNPTYDGSWEIDLDSSLIASARSNVTEAEMAFAPSSTSESTSIPTIIVQERADGLLRVEYFAQSWPHTYGLVLYNSTAPGWTAGSSVTMLFKSFGPPSAVNPQLAPRPNGNLDILVGGATVLSEYPIAWANLSSLYVYGYPGSSFIGGTVEINFYQVSQG
jgi:hypothetical protein